MREKFRREVEDLIYYVQNELTAKNYKQRKMTGLEFVQYIRIVVTAINEGKIPKMKSIWERVNDYKKKHVLECFNSKVESIFLEM